MKKIRFLATFLAVFALLLAFWGATEASQGYTNGLLAAGGILGAMTHGWVLQAATDQGLPTWVHGGNRVRLSIQFDALSVGLVPLLALLAATPGLKLRQRLARIALGGVLCFLIDALVVAAFPVLVFHKNAFTDVVGTFLGLIAFVGAPVIIWFSLTFRELQEWLPRLQPPSARHARAASGRGRR